MLLDWLSEGYPEALFWSSTLKEIDLHFRAAAERSRRAHNDRAWLAWNIYALPLQKTPRPTLAALQIKSTVHRAQTPEQRLAAVRAMARR